MNLLQDIADKVKELAGNEYLYFDDALEVKLTPHTHAVNLWGVCVSPSSKVYVMDSSEQWHEVKAHEKTIVSSLYQRVSSISLNYKKTA